MASPRGEKSRTLEIAGKFLDALKEKNPDLEIETLDLFKEDLPEIFEDSTAAKYATIMGIPLEDAMKQRWEVISKYAHAFKDADVYLISSPMWNFSIPYKLKHYIDIIVQPNILIQFTDTGVVPLNTGKKMFCVTTRGSDFRPDSPYHAYDCQESYLRAIFGFTGIYDITFIHGQPLDYAPALTQIAMTEAHAEAAEVASAFQA